jgi:pseudouridine kinase
VDEVFISIGDLGLCYASSETSGHFPAIITKVVDPTGAGDALTATVIFAFMNDLDLDDAAKLGVSAATITLRHPGTVFPGLTLECLYDELTN